MLGHLRRAEAAVSARLDEGGAVMQKPLLLALRLGWGVAFMNSGWRKLFHWPSVNYCSFDYFRSLGIPFPGTTLVAMAMTHFCCGLMLVVGFRARFAAFALSVTMVAAYVIVHREALTDSDLFVKADPFSYLFACLVVLAFGPGEWSLDRRWLGTRDREPCSPVGPAPRVL